MSEIYKPEDPPPVPGETSRKVSFWLLLALLVAVGVLFIRIIQPFIVATFVALMLAVLFSPTHHWLTDKLRGHERITAGITTALVIVVVLLPIGLTLMMAGKQAMELGQNVVGWLETRDQGDVQQQVALSFAELRSTSLGGLANNAYDRLPPKFQEHVRQSVTQAADGITSDLYDNTRGLLSDVFTFVVSFSIMALALYYFLADGKLFARGFHRMMPLDFREEGKLVDKFYRVCRGVVLGTVVAGMMQSLLSGAAFAVLGIPHVWALMVLTMFCSFVPVVGSTLVWGSVVVFLLFDGRIVAGLGLAVYGSAIIATVDNLVRAYVIGNQARLHPLVALISVLGAMKLVGLWGILVGPMVAAFFYALLNIMRDRLVRSHLWEEHPQGEVICDPDELQMEADELDSLPAQPG